MSAADVDRYEATGEAAPDLADWPVGLGAPAVDASGEPLAAEPRGRTLDLAAGERPALYGSQTAWWVMNDVGGAHTFLDTEPLGIEVRVSRLRHRRRPRGGRRHAGGDVLPLRDREPQRERHRGRLRDALHRPRPRERHRRLPPHGLHAQHGRGVQRARRPTRRTASRPRSGSTSSPAPPPSSYFVGGGPPGMIDPSTGEAIYNFMHGLWGDGTVMRANCHGYNQPSTFPVTRTRSPGTPSRRRSGARRTTTGTGRTTRSATGGC